MTRSQVFLFTMMLIPVFGYTSCSNFDDVIIPSNDTTVPVVGVNEYVAPAPLTPDGIIFGPRAFTTTIYDGDWSFAPFGIDGGGVQRILVARTIRKECGGVWTTVEAVTNIFQDTTSQTGDTVSNGMYTLINFNPKDYAPSSCKRVELNWTTDVRDFKGNTNSTWGEVRYLKPS